MSTKLIPKRRSDKIIIVVVLVLILLLFYKGININYIVSDGAIRINWFTEVVIPLKDITEVRILDQVPAMQKIIGVDLGRIKQGTYSIDGVGRVKLYVKDINRKIVLVKTEKMTYGFTPEDPNSFIKSIIDKQAEQ